MYKKKKKRKLAIHTAIPLWGHTQLKLLPEASLQIFTSKEN